MVSTEPEQPDVEAELAREIARRALFGSDTGPMRTLGRFEVLELLGKGGMGAVYLARDPELDRDLAIKIMHGTSDDPGEQLRRTRRIQREAQALAKLNHENVVTVHEVGQHAGQVFVAMEYVEGQTLGAWMRTGTTGRPQPWKDIVRVFRAAGRGLAAAHAVGLVHRDFKPDNVMLGTDGRIRVMDFGLARVHAEEGAQPQTNSTPSDQLDTSTETALTRTGSLLGTPAYMAPEQFLGSEVTAQADQFAFCVALYEALFGSRPFHGRTMQALAAAVVEGHTDELPRSTRIPSWLTRIVMRGLARDPSDRFPSMEAVLTAMDAGETRQRNRRWVGTIGTLGLAGTSVFATLEYDEFRREQRCDTVAAAIDDTWNAQTRQSLRGGLASAAADGAETAERVLPWLDAQASAWREHRRLACMNATVRRTWSDASLDKATWCLEDRRVELATVATELANADAVATREAVVIASRLSPVSTCVDETVLAVAVAPPDEGVRPQVAEVWKSLSQAAYLQSIGRDAAGLEIARAAKAQAEAIGWRPLLAWSEIREADLLAGTGEFSAAEAAATASYMDAVRADAWDLAAEAATDLVFLIGYRQARPKEAETWAEHASVAIQKAGDPLGLRAAERANHLGTVHNLGGKYEEALTEQQHALELVERALGPEHPRVATNLNNLGNVYESLGRYDEAMHCQRRALKIREETLGPAHRRVASTLENLANLHARKGDYKGSIPLYQRALAIEEATQGKDHPSTAATYINYGGAQKSQGHYDEARALFERALLILRREYGPLHPHIAAATTNLGEIDVAVGDIETAQRRFKEATDIWEETQGAEHPSVAAGLNNLANLFLLTGEYAEAKALHERALTIRTKAFGTDHPIRLYSLYGLGSALSGLGRPVEALPYLEESITVPKGSEIPADILALRQFELAKARWNAPEGHGRDRKRARALAEEARTVLSISGPDRAKSLRQVSAWLDSPSE